MTESIGDLLAQAVDEHGGRPALASADGELTYGELEELVVRLARLMEGELAGQRVAVIAPNAPVLVAGLFAAWQIGAVPVPLSARLRRSELEQILAGAEPAVVVSVAEHLGYSFAELLPELVSAPILFVSRSGEVEEERRGTASAAQPLDAEFGAILYTSGTTGSPKGALVRHAREAGVAPLLAEVLALGPQDTVGLVVPISHAFGLSCFLAGVAAGAKTALVESTFSPGPLLTALVEHDATVLHGSPALFTSLLKARPEGVPGIRTGYVAGASSPPGLLERLDELGMRILNMYGLTETGAVSCCRPDDPPDRRFTTAGRPLPGFELRLVEGELELRGPNVTPGYFRGEPQAADGWFRTGDLATLEDGYLRIVGRAKDIVHVGGFNVVPAEVEAVLLTHPDVSQAAVVGVADERMGEALAAYVVARPGSELAPADLVRFARSRIAGYKVPYSIQMLPELPLLPSGKPDRKALAG